MTITYETKADAMHRLLDLGVSLEALQRAIAAGHANRITCTDNDPPFIPGTFGWSFTVRTLRDELIQHSWRKSDPSNFSIITNDKRKLNIVVESGDAATRKSPHLTPRTKSLKGLFMEAATVRNRIEGDLFPETLSEELRRTAAILEFPTWVYLIYITDEEYRGELSLPDNMDGKQIVSWKERIFIPDSVDPFGAVRVPIPDDDLGPDIDGSEEGRLGKGGRLGWSRYH